MDCRGRRHDDVHRVHVGRATLNFKSTLKHSSTKRVQHSRGTSAGWRYLGTTGTERAHGVLGVENETAPVVAVTRFRDGELVTLNPWLQVGTAMAHARLSSHRSRLWTLLVDTGVVFSRVFVLGLVLMGTAVHANSVKITQSSDPYGALSYRVLRSRCFKREYLHPGSSSNFVQRFCGLFA